ncbi:hotdog fold domain-containing protein [Propioniciclava soli]|uniref:Hotdog fold domain-containing protein n=1 Tax=Propioniciclava soli TaxID=2775081 RepID=A0ABZ3C888_9ACTN|nr:hotdog fold domain-containing protein [Propioniciclava soli]
MGTRSAPPGRTSLTNTWGLWQRTQRLPPGVGTRLFSAAVALKAPYFRTVLPHVRVLEPGRCVVTAPVWWGVRNHIGTFHAIAACNLAEVAMGMLAEATVPPTHRWIPKAMTAQYQAKTRGGLTATASLDPLPDFAAITSGVDVVVPVSLVDAAGVESVHCNITIWVTPRR